MAAMHVPVPFHRVVVKGAGEQATGVAHRLHRCGFRVVCTEVAQPTLVRRLVAFGSAVVRGEVEVEGVRALRWDPAQAPALASFDGSHVPVFVDPEARVVRDWAPDVVVDARILKYNAGTSLEDAPLVIGLGPGLEAGRDVHVVVETLRGHDLGRLLTSGRAAADTGVPGVLGGVGRDRVLRAPVDGTLVGLRDLGERVLAGDVVATVAGEPVRTAISGVLRGLVFDGTPVQAGLKVGDVDPRSDPAACATLSDKARTLSGAVLEAILARACGRGP